MQATLWEFRHRWWIIVLIFAAAFLAYNLDPVNSGVAFVRWLARHFGTPASENAYRLVFFAGALLLFLAAFLRTSGTSYLKAEVMRDTRVHSERLVADGPYRYVRNPLYLGNILMSVGIGVLASRIGFLILSFGMTLFVMRLILREEAELLRSQGDSFRRYCAAVPRLLPSLRPRVPSGEILPHWGQAFRAELMCWLLALASAAYALTLNLKVYWAIAIPGLVSSWLMKRPPTKEASARLEERNGG